MARGATGTEEVFVVLVSGKPGREAAYGDWFAGPHMSQMRALPGVRSAHAFEVSRSSGEKLADLCALYEFADGGAALQTIARTKGTPALASSDDQGAMTWRLYETVGSWPRTGLPDGTDLIIALLETPRETVAPARLGDLATALTSLGARHVRALRLSPIQPARGSEFGAALVIGWPRAAHDPVAATKETLDRNFPGLPIVLIDVVPLRTAGRASPGRI
jgi:hypothetical protein